MMASRNISDPHELHDFLVNATRATSIFDDDVVDVLANLFIQTPRYRNLLKNVCDPAHGGNIVQRCTQEALTKHGTLICTPIRALELIVDLRMPRTRYPILQEFISDFSHKCTQKVRVQWSPRLPSLKSVTDKGRELCSEMRLEPPKLSTQDGAIGISWSVLEVVKFIQRHKVLHSAWDTSMPLTHIVRGDAFPVAGTQWSHLCITFANWGQLARNLSHQFIIGVAYCDDKDATILANLWETNIKVCVTMRPSWLFTSVRVRMDPSLRGTCVTPNNMALSLIHMHCMAHGNGVVGGWHSCFTRMHRRNTCRKRMLRNCDALHSRPF